MFIKQFDDGIIISGEAGDGDDACCREVVEEQTPKGNDVVFVPLRRGLEKGSRVEHRKVANG
jgi:hypothetical protein